MEARTNTSEPPGERLPGSAAWPSYHFYDAQLADYESALRLQLKLHTAVADGSIPGALLLLEHHPVVTMGVSTVSSNLLASPEKLSEQGIGLVRTDRGGDVTYHGPGQLVGYPILRLRGLGLDVHSYLRRLEQSIIDVLHRYGLQGKRHGNAGVWVADKKVCSIGIAVRKGVTYHGFALNVNPCLEHFALINPCGLQSEKITSMSLLLGETPAMDDVKAAAAECFEANFGVKLTPRSVCEQ